MGGRLKGVFEYIQNEESFCFTYADCMSDVDIAHPFFFINNMANVQLLLQ
jgi:glucose-1-phosphate cytidylyltransferase